jgi:hypothetical protein
MSEEINRVKVFQDAVGAWWLEFYANDVRHQVTIEDVMNGLASFVNMQETNAVLHERINDIKAAQQSVHWTAYAVLAAAVLMLGIFIGRLVFGG